MVEQSAASNFETKNVPPWLGVNQRVSQQRVLGWLTIDDGMFERIDLFWRKKKSLAIRLATPSPVCIRKSSPLRRYHAPEREA